MFFGTRCVKKSKYIVAFVALAKKLWLIICRSRDIYFLGNSFPFFYLGFVYFYSVSPQGYIFYIFSNEVVREARKNISSFFLPVPNFLYLTKPYPSQEYNARKVNCSCVYSAYILKSVLSGQNL